MTACPRINVAGTQAGGTLTIGGRSMHRPAFAVSQTTDLWAVRAFRGDDLIIPGREGVLSLPRRRTAAKVALPMSFDGQFLQDGTEAASERAGLRATVRWFLDTIVEPGVAQALVLTDPDGGASLTGPVTVEDLTIGQKSRGIWLAVLDLTIPAGRLV